MKVLRNLLFMLLIVAGVYYLIGGDLTNDQVISSKNQLVESNETNLNLKSTPTQVNPITGLSGELYDWIGKDSTELENKLGKPIRTDLSSYGYTWWVYTNESDQYIQFGIGDSGTIITVFATGNDLSDSEPVSIGQSYDEINQEFKFKEEVSFSKGIATYRFKLTSTDIKTRPLKQIGQDKFIQLYFDTYTEKLSSIRIMNSEVLLLQRPYEIYYRGDVPEPPLLTDQEWIEVDKGMEQQIFDITNIIRKRHGKNGLLWENTVAEVALGHSKDMEQNNYFSHYTQAGDGLKERLGYSNIFYLSAGENIAAQYIDGPAAVEGWLNSEGHRDALLNEDYTHLGVGVYRFYYTQNFLEKSSE